MRKVGTTYKKDGINYLVVDNDLIRKFEFKDNDAYYEHKGITHSLGMSKNTVDVSNVNNMRWMFCEAYNFNADIRDWDVSSVTDMIGLFYNTKKFNADISGWDVSSVTTMGHMFSRAHKFNADISNWDVSNVTDMSFMFCEAHNFNADISKWDVSSVTDVLGMFKGKTINDTNKHNIPKWYTDRYKQSLTIAKQKEILEKNKDLPDEHKRDILKIISLGLKEFNYKSVNVSI